MDEAQNLTPCSNHKQLPLIFLKTRQELNVHSLPDPESLIAEKDQFNCLLVCLSSHICIVVLTFENDETWATLLSQTLWIASTLHACLTFFIYSYVFMWLEVISQIYFFWLFLVIIYSSSLLISNGVFSHPSVMDHLESFTKCLLTIPILHQTPLIFQDPHSILPPPCLFFFSKPTPVHPQRITLFTKVLLCCCSSLSLFCIQLPSLLCSGILEGRDWVLHITESPKYITWWFIYRE